MKTLFALFKSIIYCYQFVTYLYSKMLIYQIIN